MATKKLTKKEKSNLVEQLFDNDITNLDIDNFNKISAADFHAEVLKQKKERGWNAHINIPCNWLQDKGDAVLKKILEVKNSEVTEKDFKKFWDIFTASVDISVWGSDVWAPRILPNGALLIRNHHRVIALDEHITGSLDISNVTLQKQLKELEKFVLANFEEDQLSIYFSFIHREQEGINWTSKVPDKLSDFGQTLFFLSTEVINKARESGNFEPEHIVFNETAENAGSTSRSGHCVMRIYKDKTFFYSTYRAGDEYDTILENYSYYLGESSDQEETMEYEVNCDQHFIYSFIKENLEGQSEPEIFDEETLSNNEEFKQLFSEKLYSDYAQKKSYQVMEFTPFFRKEWNLPPTYYLPKPPFFELSQKYDGRLIVVNFSLEFLPNLEGMVSAFSSKLSSMVSNIMDGSTIKILLPLEKYENDVDYMDADIFNYGSVELEKRVLELKSAMDIHFKEYMNENPNDENDLYTTQKDWIDSYGYDYMITLLIIPNETPDPFTAHKYGIDFSAATDSSLNVQIPSYGYYQGYSAGELDTGNSQQFLSSEALQYSSNDDYEDEEDN